MSKQRTARPRVSRCPDCGQRLDEDPPIRCPLCGLEFGDRRSTSDDSTPFSDAYSREVPGWWRMCTWVYGARSMRIKHLGLMRSSSASRYFARVNVVLMSLALGVIAFTDIGWHRASVPASIDKADPQGAGWFRLARGVASHAPGGGTAYVSELWWNPAQAIIATAFAVAGGWLVLSVLLASMRKGVTLAHRESLRHEQRMTAAINYSTAWFMPMLSATLIVALRPLSYYGSVAGWSGASWNAGLRLIAGVIAGFGAAMWWFWLARLGAATSPSTRGGVTAFFALGVPVLVVACLWLWWYAVNVASLSLCQVLELDF